MHPLPSEITPAGVYAQRRLYLQSGLALAAGSALGVAGATTPDGTLPILKGQPSALPGVNTMERPTTLADATSYNNFYEFSTDKAEPAKRAHVLVGRPWTVRVDGLVNKPMDIGLEDLLRLSPMEERIYRLRCVEGWSMVIPWVGYSLSKLIDKVQPQGSAKFLEFTTLADPAIMPGVRSRVLDWPYVEGLRMDEARHPLTLLAMGMYGQVLPGQNGAPVRLVVPWKYGFKSAKSLVRIRFVEQQPVSAWGRAAPGEYGFYSNVNPQVDHPRWSQATERRIGEGGLFAPRRQTQMFNGYAEQVAHLYAGMDLKKFF